MIAGRTSKLHMSFGRIRCDQLSDKLDGVLSGLRQRGVLTEPMIRKGLAAAAHGPTDLARNWYSGRAR